MEEALRYALDIAKGLAYLHGKATPVIHRDLKPGNILLTSAHEGCCKLADFGISQELTAEKLASIARCPRTASGQVLRVRSASEANTGTEAQEGASEGQGNGDGGREMEPPSEHGEFDPERAPGTFRYMAPETLRGEAYGLQVDQYSFGLIMYEVRNPAGIVVGVPGDCRACVGTTRSSNLRRCVYAHSLTKRKQASAGGVHSFPLCVCSHENLHSSANIKDGFMFEAVLV